MPPGAVFSSRLVLKHAAAASIQLEWPGTSLDDGIAASYYFIGGGGRRSLWARVPTDRPYCRQIYRRPLTETTRETRYCTLDARPSRRSSVWTTLIDDAGRRWQGVARLIRRVQRRLRRRRQIGRHPTSYSMCPDPPARDSRQGSFHAPSPYAAISRIDWHSLCEVPWRLV